MHPYMKEGIVLFAQQSAQMQNADIAVDDRVDIASVRIDMDAPAASRAGQYLSQIKNPYAFKCGEIAVNVQFPPTGKPLKEAVISYLSAIKKNN